MVRPKAHISLDDFHIAVVKPFRLLVLKFDVIQHLHLLFVQFFHAFVTCNVVIVMENRVCALQVVAVFKRLVRVKKYNPVSFYPALVPINSLPPQLPLGVIFVVVLNGVLGLHPLRR